MLLAYIGPGAGFVLGGTFVALIVGIFTGLVSLIRWPVRFIYRTLRGGKAYREAKVKRIVYLGLDGLDPKLCEQFMAEDKLPNLQRLRAEGGYSRLRTTFPCLSPVAWSCFATGANPAKHNIFGFLSRSTKTYMPELSSSVVRPPSRVLEIGKLEIPLGRPEVEMRRKSVPFWKLLGEHDIHSTILRVPITFPPEEFNGHLLSAMCTPDLRGTQGSFSFYSTAFTRVDESQGMRIPLRKTETGFESKVLGPQGPEGDALEVPFSLRRAKSGEHWELEVDKRTHELVPGKYSEWIPLRFSSGMLGSAKGIVRVLITSTEPEVELYMTPINIDPESPALPISYPENYAVYLAKLMGSYSTLGLAEDTWALNERVIDEQAFLDQAYLNHGEREQMFFNALEKTPRGVVACVFDASDRIQHMFYRTLEPDHPANRGRETEAYTGVLEDMYKRMDDLVGRTMQRLDEDTLLFVLSDHGFESFQRGVNLNTWLHQNGYLVMKEGAQFDQDFFRGVDWSKTRAYAVGLGGLYINRVGRESKGIVKRGEVDALKRELAAKLDGLVDPERGATAIIKVHLSSDLYKGPYLNAGPDLLIGYNKGYRASWASVTGGVSVEVFEDNSKAWGGDHCIDPDLVPGVLFSNKKVLVDDPGIEDLAPNTMSMFGLKPPRHMEGRPIIE